MELPEKVVVVTGAGNGASVAAVDINNEALSETQKLAGTTNYTVLDRVMNINFFGVVNMTKEFLPHLLDRPVGHIVNVSIWEGCLRFLLRRFMARAK